MLACRYSNILMLMRCYLTCLDDTSVSLLLDITRGETWNHTQHITIHEIVDYPFDT